MLYKDNCRGCNEEPDVVVLSSDPEDNSTMMKGSVEEPETEEDTSDIPVPPPSCKKRRRSEKLSDTLWNEMDVPNVDHLPWDINGTTIFKLKIGVPERYSTSKDGRPWKKSYDSNKCMQIQFSQNFPPKIVPPQAF